MHLEDEGNFRKARGFLVTFSIAVYLLWYFSVNVSSINYGGQTLRITDNATDVWFAIALINFYFWLRYIQHLPDNALHFDNEMITAFDRSMISLSTFVYRRTWYKKAATGILSQATQRPEIPEIYNRPSDIRLTYKKKLEKLNENGEDTLYPHSLGYKDRAELRILYISIYSDKTPEIYGVGQLSSSIEMSPHPTLYWLCTTYVFCKGGLLKPWVTNYILPLMLGYVSIALALLCWLKINNVQLIP